MYRNDPFVGRGEEIALIRRVADLARAGQVQFVVIEGFTGSGKTRLLHRSMEPFPEWNERTILLDESFTDQPGAAIRHVFGADSTGPDELEDVLAAGFDAAQNLERPHLMSVKNLHLIDKVSADALWRVLSVFQNGPVLVVLSTQGSVRPEVQRLIRLAQASPRGTYIRLQPLPLREVAELLEAHCSLPVAASVAAQVMMETDGYPGLVEQVGRWLGRVPAGDRSIEQALAATARSADYSGMHQDVMTQMNRLHDADRRAVALLAAADTSLSRSQMESALGATVDPAALLSTSLLSWEEFTGGYAVPRRSLSRAVLSRTPEKEQAQLSLKLSAVLQGQESVHHLAEAIRRDPSLGDAAAVIAQLQDSARAAAGRREFREAFHHAMTAVSMDVHDAESLRLLAGLAVRADRVSDLLVLEPLLRALPTSTCRSGILALIMLEKSDLEAALHELESVTLRPDRGLSVYAEAVIAVSARLHVLSRGRRAAALGEQVSAAVAAVLNRVEGVDILDELFDEGQLRGVDAVNSMWVGLAADDAGDASVMIDRVSAGLTQLRGAAGVERFEGYLCAMRGALHRQLGQMDRAYQDLSVAAAQGGTSSHVMYARSQLALLLFSAAYWDEAEQMADRAAGEALARGENAVSHLAYAVSAIVPAARGEVAKVRSRLEVIRLSPFARDPLVAGTIDWVEACLASSQSDFGAVARNLLSMRNDGAAWWAMEPQAVSMLARALRLSGWAAMLPALLRSDQREPGPVDFQRHLTTSYLRGSERWGAGAPLEAMDSFLEVLRGYDAAEPIRPTQPLGEGGGFRVFRAMLSIDIAALVAAYPQELSRQRATALELAVWAASVLQSCGPQAHLDRVNQLMETLRPRILGADSAGSPGAAGLADSGRAAWSAWVPAGVQEAERARPAEGRQTSEEPTVPGATPAMSDRAEAALRGLSRRERQVSVLVSQGRTNREVAEQLVLSVRTVEYHVANAMAKLQIRSRRELRGLLSAG